MAGWWRDRQRRRPPPWDLLQQRRPAARRLAHQHDNPDQHGSYIPLLRQARKVQQAVAWEEVRCLPISSPERRLRQHSSRHFPRAQAAAALTTDDMALQ